MEEPIMRVLACQVALTVIVVLLLSAAAQRHAQLTLNQLMTARRNEKHRSDYAFSLTAAGA
jgi:ABC-type sulfate transport system permease component